MWTIAYSPDGLTLVTGSQDGTAKIWNAFTGQEILTIPAGNGAAVTTVAFSPDGTILATGGIDKTSRLWDASTGKLLVTLPIQSTFIWQVAFSPDGKRLAAGYALEAAPTQH